MHPYIHYMYKREGKLMVLTSFPMSLQARAYVKVLSKCIRMNVGMREWFYYKKMFSGTKNR